MSSAWAALADPTRRTLVERLARAERSAGELGEGLGLSQPAVSRHLRVLREAGLVDVEPDAQRRVYRLRPGAVDEVADWADEVRRFWGQRLDALDTEIRRGRRSRTDREDET